MIYQLVSDSSHYMNWTPLGKPLYPFMLWCCKIFGPARLDVSVLIQMGVILYGSLKLTQSLSFSNKWLEIFSFCVLSAPMFYWGRHICADSLAYGIFILSVSYFGVSNFKFLSLAALATLTRSQYFSIPLALIINKKWRWWVVTMLFVSGVLALKSEAVLQRLGPATMYASCVYQTKPPRVSHHFWFDEMIANKDSIAAKSIYCSAPKINWWHFADTVMSKVYENFRLHQLFVIPFLLMFPCRKVRGLAAIATSEYALVFVFSSPYHQRYTFMVEMVLIVALAKALDNVFASVPQ